MQARPLEVVFALGRHACSLQAGASRIFNALGIGRQRLVERHGPNQSYDFYWEGQRDGVVCRVRGSEWDPQLPQTRFHVELSRAAAAAAMLERLREYAAQQGWSSAEVADA
ncbi:hypothetical protein [Lysobacter sp. cf310]|uniref:hypothetical protein n=1 Tax=Lysobacter sp. cf310 TaxID=1761790 RepID=UPI0008DF30B1|nr:hypothetical protein [Lysobacter sp. cf310]SFK95588.1 hypothetical protein SAMN04487938_2622 [Lysobacter sp. cf310]